MPLIYLNYPVNTLSLEARDKLAEELTIIGLDCENLPATPFIRSTVWLYFNEFPSSHVYHNGRPGGTPVISLEVNVFAGGLDESAKRMLFERFTRAIRQHTDLTIGAGAPVYIVVRDVPPANFGVSGGTTTLDALRHSDPGTPEF